MATPKSPELELEPYGPTHVDAVQRLAPDPENLRFTLMPAPYPEDGARTFLDLLEVARAEGTEDAFAILVDREVAGMCGLHEIDLHRGSAEVGYWVGAPFRRRGVASGALRQLLERCRSRGLLHLRAHTIEANAGSIRVLEQCDFELAERIPNMGRHERWPADSLILQYRRELA